MRTAAANEKVDGRFRIVAMQFSRTLFVRGGAQFSWLIEVLSGTVGAPSFRIPTQETNPEAFSDPKKYARYTLHHVYGVGFAPLSAQMVKPFTNRFATLLSGIAAGYALHHVSNGSLGESNPGMNSHLLFLKMSKSLRR